MKILIATDGSPSAVRACEHLKDLAGLSGAEVRLLTVLSFSLDPYTALGEPLADTPERKKAELEAIELATEGSRRALEGTGARVTVAHRFGFVADEVLEEAEEWGPDLIVVGRRGQSPVKRWLLGSVSERIVHHAAVPVLLVP